MAGPTLTSLLQKANIAPGQSVGKTEAKKVETSTKVVLDGDVEEAKSTSEAAAKTAKKQSAKEARKGQTENSSGGVQRRRVKLKKVAQEEVSKEFGGKESQKTDKTNKTREAMLKGQTKETTETHQPNLLERAHEGEQAKAQTALGVKKALGRLNEQSRFNQSSVKYETARNAQNEGVHAGLTPKAQQKWMLNNLCSMLNICVEQHTGGKAGEAFESRRDTRLIYMALRGLRDGNQKPAEGSTSTRSGMSNAEYASNQKKAQVIFMNIIEPPTRPESMPEYSEVA